MYKIWKSVLLAMLLHFFGRSLLISIMKSLREFVHYIPASVRRFFVLHSILLPLGLPRFFLNLARKPIGDERKWIHKIEEDTWKGAWIVANVKNLKEAQDVAVTNDLVIFYAHGGGFCMGNATMYIETFQLIVNHLQEEHQVRASILSLDYSLSPESVWPKACNESMDAYNYLIQKVGVNPSKIVLAGDSAGGNLVATTLLMIKAQENSKDLLPLAAALLSPWIDLTPNLAGFDEYSLDFISPRQISQSISYYIPNYNKLDEESKKAMLRNPLISPFYGDFSDVCPIFISFGEEELLKRSIEDFTLNLEQSGCNVTTFRGENAFHVWLVCRLTAESQQIYERDCRVFIDWIASNCKKQQNMCKLSGELNT